MLYFVKYVGQFDKEVFVVDTNNLEQLSDWIQEVANTNSQLSENEDNEILYYIEKFDKSNSEHLLALQLCENPLVIN